MKRLFKLIIYTGISLAGLFHSTSSYSQKTRGQFKLVSEQDIFKEVPFASCHASSITELTDGRLLSVWFGGPDEGDKNVCIWGSVYSAKQWSQPVQLADGIINDTLRYPCWNPVVFMNKTGSLFLYYKVGPNPREWWGMMRRSADDGKTWSDPERLPEGILGPIKNKPVQLSNGTILHPSSTESVSGRKWLVHMEQTDSGSKNWKKINIDNDSFAVIQPTILLYPGNRIQILSRSRQNVVVESWSTDNGNTWGPLAKTRLANPNSGIDGVTTHSGVQVLVYNPAGSGKEWSDGRNELRVAASSDGKNWKDVYTLVKKDKGEFSYPAIIQTRDGLLHITYTYDRLNIRHVILKM